MSGKRRWFPRKGCKRRNTDSEGGDQTETEIVSVLNPREQFQMWQLEQKLLAQLARMEDSEKKEVSLP